MIDNLQVENFKCLSNESFDFKKLNIITGVNCAGKSSVIQSILLYSDALQETGNKLKRWKFETYRNKLRSAEKFSVLINGLSCSVKPTSFEFIGEKFPFSKDRDFFYLSEDRRGPKNDEKFIETDEMGDRGEYVMSYYYRHQNEPIHQNLQIDENETLSYNVSHWLKEILFFGNKETAVDVDLFVEESTEEKVRVSYDFGGLKKLSPKNLGAGLSYLAKVVIVCLQMKPGKTVIIENPEIHLHPGAQSGIGHFLSFIASRGVQVIVETHCEHLINRVQYEVFKKRLNSEDVSAYYKKSFREDFEKLNIGSDGHFQKDGKRIFFPEVFFDATLNELVEMG